MPMTQKERDDATELRRAIARIPVPIWNDMRRLSLWRKRKGYFPHRVGDMYRLAIEEWYWNQLEMIESKQSEGDDP